MNIGHCYKTWGLAVAASAALTACGGGGGGGGGGSGGEAPAPSNFTAGDLRVETQDPTIGHPLSVSLTIGSDTAVDDLSVSLFATEQTDDPDAQPEQFPLGSHTFTDVEAGARSYEFEVSVPSSVELPGAYFITAIVDPVDEVAESDEEDNTAAVEAMLSQEDRPNLILAELALDRAAMLINTDDYDQQVPGTEDNVYNADAGGTVTVAAHGLGVDETVDIEAFASLRLMRSDSGTSHEVPLYLWHSGSERYINAYGIDPESGIESGVAEWLPLGEFTPQLIETAGDDVVLNDVERDSAHMNFYVPGRLGSVLEKAMRFSIPVTTRTTDSDPLPKLPPPDLTAQAINALEIFLYRLPTNGIWGDETEAMAVMDFTVCVEIRPADASVSDYLPEDNEVCSPLDVVLPPYIPPLSQIDRPPGLEPSFTPALGENARRVYPVPSGAGYKTQSGGSVFKFGLDFGSSVSADHRGYIEQVHGDIPITVFGVKGSFMKAAVRAQLVPDYPGKPAEEESSFTIEIRHAGQLLASVAKLPSNVDVTVDLASISKEYPNPAKEFTMFVGPIPLSVGASVAGNFGVEYQPFKFTTEPDDYRLGISGGPYANVEATLYAGVGRGPFIAGVEGVLSLLDERIVFFNGVEIEMIEPVSVASPIEFVIRQGPKITNEFTGPLGKLNLFAKYSVPTIKTCKAGPFKFPCPGFKSIKATKNIWKSKALFQLKDVLLDNDNLALDVIIIDGEEPAYYSL
ncbi:MAG: hypothetical protein WDZ30_07165 [Cellvibrionaceae bacterium]